MGLENLPDYILIDQWKNGSEKAFEIIFDRYFYKLYKFILKYLKDEDIAKELVMDIMFRMWQKKDSLVVEEDLSPFLFRSCKNAIFNYCRRKALETISFDISKHDHLLSSNPADHQLDEKELATVYQMKLNQLSPQSKLIFEMSRHKYMTHAEIAESLDLSIHTVKNHMKTALNFFRENLGEYTGVILILILVCFIAL